MPSKLRKAIGAVKDQTSISLAKVTNAANLEVAILKATTHDKNPIEERYVNEIVSIVSSNKIYASACAHCIGKRIGKTHNWVVALKSLMIVLRIFQDGDPYFPREVFHAMKRGAKILNLSSFKDDSNNSSPWDYTAFIRTFALYLDERLDCFLTGKLQRRFTYHNSRFRDKNGRSNKLWNEPGIKDMKPTMVLDKISHWQRLLDRAIGTRPTGSAKTNRLVQISLYAVVQESFDLYRDISDGLAVVLDSFFHLPLSACVTAFNACVKSYKQFNELSAFYSFCASIGVGRSYEYPSVQKVSEELMETLQEFLKDQPNNNISSSSRESSRHFYIKDHVMASSSSSQDELASERYGTLERFFESGSEFGSQCTSLEDLMSATDAAMSPRRSLEHDVDSEQSDPDDKDSQYDDFASANGSGSTKSLPVDQSSRSSFDVVSFDDLQQEDQQHNELDQLNTKEGLGTNGSKDCWEIVLAKTVTETSPKLGNGIDLFDTLFDQVSVPQHHKYNPFLEEDIGTVDAPSTTTTTTNHSFCDVFDLAPTFYTQDPLASTFSNQSSGSMTNLDMIFGDINPNETTMAPTFRAQCSFQNEPTPTFQVQDLNFNATTTMEAPTHVSQDPFNLSMVPFHFEAHDFFDSTVAPTFSARDCNETTTFLTSKEDDPFGPWPSAKSNDQTQNELMQQEILLRQQQLWLEQQNKIIAKHMT